jgi:DNA-binding transcriptional ArsR family regulator
VDDVSVVDRSRASVALKPLRVRILAAARQPISATALAADFGLSRQAVNYHVRALAKAGFLRRAGRQQKRGLVEQKYVVTARAFLVAPDVLGPFDAGPNETADRFSVAYLLTLAARMQKDATRAWQVAQKQGKRVPVLTLDTELRFESPEQRAGFAEALTAAITRVIAEHSGPAHSTRGTAPGRTYRLALGCYPI